MFITFAAWPLDQPRATFGTVSGFWNLQKHMKHVLLPGNLKRGKESVISGIPEWTGLIVVTKDGEAYRPGVNIETVKSFYQSLSMRNGLIHTNITWSPASEGLQYQLNYTVFAHHTRPNLGVVRLDVSVNQRNNFSVIDVLDGTGAVRANFNAKSYETENNSIWTSVKPDGIDYKTAHIYSTLVYEHSDKLLLQSINRSRRDATGSSWVSRNISTIAQSWDLELDKNQTLTLYKYVGIASDDAFPLLTFETAKKSSLEAINTGWDSLLRGHVIAWDEIWNSADIVVPGDTDLQTGVRASIFHILIV